MLMLTRLVEGFGRQSPSRRRLRDSPSPQRREAAIETAVRVGAGGRILGFDDRGSRIEGQVRPVFSPDASRQLPWTSRHLWLSVDVGSR